MLPQWGKEEKEDMSAQLCRALLWVWDSRAVDGDFLTESRITFYDCSHDSPDLTSLLLEFLVLCFSPSCAPRCFFLSHTLISLLPFNLVSAFIIIKRCILFKLRTRSTELLPFSYILPFHSQFVSLKVFISSNTDNVKMSWHCYYCV